MDNIRRFIENISPFIGDNNVQAKIRVDIGDIFEAVKWLSDYMEDIENSDEQLNEDEIENIIINLDIEFVRHIEFHINSLREIVEKSLSEKFPNA